MGIKYSAITGKLLHTINDLLVDVCPDACVCCDGVANDKAYVRMQGWPTGNCCNDFNGCWELDQIADCEWEGVFTDIACCGAIEGTLQPGALLVPGLRGASSHVKEMLTFGLGFANNAAPGNMTLNLLMECVGGGTPSNTVTLTLTCGAHVLVITRTVPTQMVDCDLPLGEGIAPSAAEIADFTLCDASGVTADFSLMPLSGCECTCCEANVPDVINAYPFAIVGFGGACNDPCESLNGPLVALHRMGTACTWTGTAAIDPCYPMSTMELTMVCDADDTTITLVWMLSITEIVVYRLVVPTATIDCAGCEPLSLEYVVGGTTCGFGGSFIDLYPSGRQVMFDVTGVGNDEFNCPGECPDLNAAFVLDPGPTQLLGSCTLPWNPAEADYVCDFTIQFPFCAGGPGDDVRFFQIRIYGFLGVGWKVLAGYKSPGTYNHGGPASQSDICIVWLKETAGTGVLEDYTETFDVFDECGACGFDCDWDVFQPSGTYQVAVSVI